jgi:glycosidase
MGTPPDCNVADQRDDPGSVLSFTRDLVALRRSSPDLSGGTSATLASPPGTWAWQRGDGFATALNLGEETSSFDGLAGSIALATDRGRDGESVERLVLPPGQGALVRLA